MINEYIQTYGKRLWGLCVTLCRNTADADDLYQETWLRAFKNIDRFDKTKDFLPYLSSICVNIYKNAYNRNKRSPVYNDFKTSQEKDEVLVNVQSDGEEDYSDLHRAIDTLPPKLRIAVILFYFEDMDVKQTALSLGVPQGTVKSRLNKARKLLKEALSDETDIQL